MTAFICPRGWSFRRCRLLPIFAMIEGATLLFGWAVLTAGTPGGGEGRDAGTATPAARPAAEDLELGEEAGLGPAALEKARAEGSQRKGREEKDLETVAAHSSAAALRCKAPALPAPCSRKCRGCLM